MAKTARQMLTISCYFTYLISSMSTLSTFEVDEVERAENPLPVAGDMLELITTKINVRPESCCRLPTDFSPVKSQSTMNSFVEAVHLAYSSHYPLVLSPDIIWQCVAQGFAIHVNRNAENLRHMFVDHEGKKELVVRRDDFVKGSPDNDWEQVFGAFSEQIQENVGDEIHSLLTPDFSTTGPVERAASQIVLMDTFKEYFEYTVVTLCGIPTITLEGTVEDWETLREKTLSLSRFDFQWWTDAIRPILDEFVSASSGVINKEFWQTIYKVSGGSGGPYITGWMLTLFPYVGHSQESMVPNSYLQSWGQAGVFSGVTTGSFPPGTVSTPFTWKYFWEVFDMYFYAGFVGVGQDNETLALKPVIGWAVVDKEEEGNSTSRSRMDNLSSYSCRSFVQPVLDAQSLGFHNCRAGTLYTSISFLVALLVTFCGL